jgi:F-type H+-transporting ATPase subunit b
MNIIPDPLQVLLNTLPFLVAIIGLYRIILKPMLDYLLGRDAAIRSGHDETARIEAEIESRMTEYDAKLAEARAEVASIHAAKRADAQEEYDARVGQARSEAEAQIETAVGEITVARDAASAQLKTMSGEIAEQVAGRVLGRSLTAGA